jgi:hypothetical protein
MLSFSIRRGLFTLAILMVAFVVAKAQVTATVGTGTSNNYLMPINSLYGYSYTQQLYPASAISAAGGTPTAGAIRKIRFSIASTSGSTYNDDWTIYMGNTTKTSFSSTTDWIPLSSLTSVFSGTVSFSGAGWVEITLSTPFVWDGTSNIVVAIDENAASYTCCTYFNYTSSTNAGIYYRSDGTNPNPSSPPTASSRTSYYPNIQMVFQNDCTGTPTAGIATASVTTICLGKTVDFNITGGSTDAGLTYQWQYSPDNIVPYTNISGQTGASMSIPPTAAGYFRRSTTCSASGLSANSTAVQVLFSSSLSSSSGATRCGTGTTTLTASAPSGTTVKWYAGLLGGAPLGSGTSFTTPTISATTTYYAAAESSSSGTVSVGTGTATTSSATAITPFSLYYTSAHTQYILSASDLAAAGIGPGNLNSLGFNVTSKASSIAYNAYTIKLAHTTATALSGILSPTFSTVWGPMPYNSVSGMNTFTFSSAFNWDGTSNILVDVCFDNVTSGTGYSSSDAVAFVTKSYAATYGLYSDPTPLCGASSGGSSASSNSVPLFSINGNIVCSSPRVPVTATVNTAPAFAITGTQTVCNNTAATLSVTSTLSNYTSYTWSPATGLFTDAACTVPYTSGSSAATVYSKNATAAAYIYTANAFHSSTLCSGVGTATVTNLPSSLTTIATPSSLCFSGNTKMTFTPSTGLGAAQFQWQSSANNSTWSDSTGMTGTSLTTPTLSNTRYYRVVLKNSSGTFCLNATSDTALIYKPSVLSTTDGSRCATGTVNLAATATDGTLQWYSASSGGSLLATGTSFTTPIIGSTTTYYVQTRATDDQSFQIGSAGTTLGSTGLSPFSQYYESSRTQYLVLASDLAAAGVTAGQFATLAFNISTKSSSLPYKGYTVALANTTATSLSGFVAPTFTTVYGPTDYTSTSGLNTLPLSGGFVWDGSSNLLVQICFSNATGAYDGWSSDDVVKATTKSYTASYGTYADNSYFCSGGTGSIVSTTVLPDMVFTRLGCVSSRSPVVATINPNPTPTISPSPGPISICEGYTTTLTGGGGSAYQWKDASGPISGATSTTYTTGTAGTYQVVVINSSTGCKDSSAMITVNVNPSPKVNLSPTGTTAICADSALAMTGTAIGTGLTYKWFRNDTAITGATALTYSASAAGRYTFRAYLGSCADTSKELVLNVNPLPASSFTKTGSTGAICLGSTLELTALSVPAGYKYQWFYNNTPISGATSQIYNAANGGYYKVRITDANNCRNMSDSLMIINTPMGVPPLSPTNASFCEGATIMLYSNAGPYAVKYAWAKDGLPTVDTTPNIVTASSGWYEVTATDVYGCKATSAKVRVDVLPGATKPVIVRSGMTLSTSTVYSTYQWYRNGKIISGATSRYYTISFDGDYKVVVSNSTGCYNTSDVLKLNATGVSEVVSNGEIRLYPNPSDGIINIESPVKVQVTVRDIQGREVASIKDATTVDLRNFSDGMYLFYILDETGNLLRTEKILKASH